MSDYIPSQIEPKWQALWEADGLYHADIDESKPKHYALTMLPYPSGDLHIGHWYAFTPSDAHARFMRMNGYNVLLPIGFDAFGLPAENAAIKDGIHPMKRTYENIEQMRKQLRSMGAMWDWRREAISSNPEYYKWTQWFFIQLFKHGLAYRKLSPVDFCPHDNTTLAREQVWGEDRHCERCGTPVIKKNLAQWFFKTTAYADELLNFAGMDWPERVKVLQTNWIGRSEGAEVNFPLADSGSIGGDPAGQTPDTRPWITVFTTRPDTLWGVTFMVLSPEHPLVDKITTQEHMAEVEAYKIQAARQSDIDREAVNKEKTGVFTGSYVINPVNGERTPIWIADYVLMTYGTGAIMAVPAHDQRDFEFARKYGIEVRVVIQPDDMPSLDGASMPASVPASGKMVNSGLLTGTSAEEAYQAALKFITDKGIGKASINYKLRDWLISRQRYWGAPIPMIYCQKDGWNPVPDAELPVLLPEDVAWKPTGESPLKLHPTWKNAKCPVCGEPAERETDTMDTFMCSSWYHLRYLSPHYDQGPFDPKEYDYWMPVDTYTGGIEHANMHLIYTRFFHKALRDMGITEGPEPMIQLRNQGMVLGEDNEKMSKSRGNVVDPDDLVARYGADAVRAFLMFFARWDMGAPWNPTGIDGTVRWLRRVWTLVVSTGEVKSSRQPLGFFKGDVPDKDIAGAMLSNLEGNREPAQTLRRRVHQMLKRITRDFKKFEFNTVVSGLMELLNEMYAARDAGVTGTQEWMEAVDIYLRMLAPVCPHIAEELWEQTGREYSIHNQPWPKVDEEAAREQEIVIPVQVNGKLRDRVVLPADVSEEEIKSAALASKIIQKYLEGKPPKKVIVAQKKLVNIVI
ncbi:MAG: leucine--tRNA ligase [Anaerolineales bacterium]|jgi:leucyl-tRNA synthetase